MLLTPSATTLLYRGNARQTAEPLPYNRTTSGLFTEDLRKAHTPRAARARRPSALSWDLISLNDQAIPPAGQMFMAQQAHAHVESVRSAHDVMISHPAAVVRIIIEAATAVS
jgi:hypothetical protein